MKIIRASAKGDLELVKKCISEGASVDVTDKSKRTALIEAAWGGFDNLVEFLLENGSDINHADSSGFTALMRAVESGHHTTAKMLIDHGADVNSRGYVRGSTPLMLAAEQGDEKSVELLLDNGARINAIDQFDETALARAYRCEHINVVSILEERGATRKPERAYASHDDRELRPFTKAHVPQWSSAAEDAGFDDEESIPEEVFEEE
jgi:ankyrin repeat protein